MSEQVVPRVAVISSANPENWYFLADLVPSLNAQELPVFRTRDPVMLVSRGKDWTPVWDALTALKASARPEQFDLLTRLQAELDKMSARFPTSGA